MIILLIILAAISVYGMEFSPSREKFMSIPSTGAIKGIFAVLILFSHMRGYLSFTDSWSDRSFIWFMNFLSQLMVSMYFFYSGYGIVESVERKRGYVRGFFKNRILKTLFHFDIAVFLYLVLQTAFGKTFSPSDYLFCWIGWRSLGNSAWFIFVMLSLYGITWLTLVLGEKYGIGRAHELLLVTVVSIALWLFLYLKKGGEYWWYDTLLTFPAGMWFSYFLRKVKSQGLTLNNKDGIKWIIVVFAALSFIIWRKFIGIDSFGICSIIFALMITFLTLLFQPGNPILDWLGVHCFSLYILQRIPMIFLSYVYPQMERPLWITIVIISTLFIAYLYTTLISIVDSKIFKPITL